MVLSDLMDRPNGLKDISQNLVASSDSLKAALNEEIYSLNQEIYELTVKLFASANLQRQYEEQIKKRYFFEQEYRFIKAELEKANVRKFYHKCLKVNRKDGLMLKKKDMIFL